MAKRRYKETEKRIANLEKEGRGAGHGANYAPWVRIHDLSSRGRVHRRWSATSNRVVHLLSDIEEDVFMQFDASPAVIDIREQFPLPRAETTLIAEKLGYRHPSANGVVVVMTTDLVVDLVGGKRVAVAVKPAFELSKVRVLQKLEIEKAFWAGRGVSWRLVTDAQVTHGQRLNKQEQAEWADLGLLASPEQYDARAADMLLDIADTDGDERLVDVLKASEVRRGWSPGDGLAAVKRLLAIRALVLASSARLDVFGPTSQLVVTGA